MLKHVRVVPLAAESLGVRSMCTFVETPDIRILLDAGVSLCPNRFGFPPHPTEFKAIDKARRKIAETAERAEIVTLSHYHFDHHTPSYEDWLCNWTAKDETARQIYEGKTVLIKNPKENINFSQRRRGWIFQKTGGKYANKLEIADGKTFLFGKATKVRFSEPVFHGPENSALGWILMTTIEYEGEKFMFAPDVQGPMANKTLKIIADEKPQLLMIGGPPLYLARFKVDEKQIQIGMENLEKVVEVSQMVILEHHILRDESWREKAKDVFEKAQMVECKVLTAAEFLGEKNAFLEAIRKRLYVENPPSREFEKWMNSNMTVKKGVKPPI
ncbi:MAG: MBL fold metallo-hydrolase [Candidatus Bathycorpusculaceae bacterium]